MTTNNDRFLTRVFDKRIKKMLYSGVNYQFLSDDGITYYDSCFESFEDGLIPMNCMGRKDANGKLVYEDDFVSPAPGSVIFQNEDCVNWIGRIESVQDDGDLLLCWIIMGIAAWSIEKCIIRGNTYENPELLKKQEQDK
jgi:hypothetical protein